MDTPLDNLYRGVTRAPALRSVDDTDDLDDLDDGSVDALMTGHFAMFNQWTEIDSWYEGRFLEALIPGCFTKTLRENLPNVRVQFDHGYDSHVSSAPLGPIDTCTEDDTGVFFEVPLLDTDYNRNRILPLLSGRLMSGEQRGSLLGASFRFRIVKEEWNDDPGTSDTNPLGLPERRILEVRLSEFGPVVFPAYPGATAGVGDGNRSLTDHYIDRRREQRCAGHTIAPPAGTTTGTSDTTEPTAGHSDDRSDNRLALHTALTELTRLGGTK